MDTQLKELYYDPKFGYLSATKLYRKAKELGLKATMKEVKQFLSEQETAQINKQTTRKTKYRPIVAHYVNDIWQADLLDMQKWSKFNKGYKWILSIVDIYSRYSWAIPLYRKSTALVRDEFEKLFNQGNQIENLTTDNGKEFTGKAMKSLLKEFDVKHWTHEPGTHNTLGIVERLNRTFRTLIQKYMTANKTKNWINVLSELNDNYNSTYHETIRSIPNEIYFGKQRFNNRKLYCHNCSSAETFTVGDMVRLRVRTHKLEKKGELFSRKIYVISSETKTKNSYKVKPINDGVVGDELKRTIKPYEMQKIKKISSINAEDETPEVEKELRKQNAKRKYNKLMG